MDDNDRVTVRLHPVVLEAVRRRQQMLQTTLTWLIEAALVELLRDDLPPGFRAGMPYRSSEDPET